MAEVGMLGFPGTLAAAYLYAMIAWPFLRFAPSTLLGRLFTCAIATAVLPFPWCISADKVFLRAMACLVCIELFFKMYDYAMFRKQATETELRFSEYAKFLVPIPFLVTNIRFHQRKRTGPTSYGLEGLRMVLGGVALAGCFGVMHFARSIEFLQGNFLADHLFKMILFLILTVCVGNLLMGIERLLGIEAQPIMRSVWKSRTVAEFWVRYNTRVHQWLDTHVYRPWGGRRSPLLSIFMTFFVSGVLHEAMFAVATSRLDGYQLSFFVLQFPGIVISSGLSRLAARYQGISHACCSALAYGFTLVWMLSTSVLFFNGIHRVLGFFYAGPSWLP